MKVFSQIKGVEVRRESRKGNFGMTQFVCCHTCDNELRISPAGSGTVMPEEFVFKKAGHEGWQTKKNGRHVCPKCLEAKKMEKVDDTPREMTTAERRSIFREIDDCYDDKNTRYVDNITDATIAKKLGVPRKWVEDLRNENFGPSGENTEMERVTTLIGRLGADLTDAINRSMDSAAECERLKGEVDAARAAIVKIKEAVGPHRAA